MTWVLAIAGAVLALDQGAKCLVLARLAPGTPVAVVADVLNLTLVRNPGLAFGVLSGLPAGWRWVVAVLSIAAVLVLGRLALGMLPVGGWPARLSLGLIFGGAIGNLIDRARWGSVVDFIDVYWKVYHWPAFNVADSSISVGVALLVLRLLVGDRHRG